MKRFMMTVAATALIPAVALAENHESGDAMDPAAEPSLEIFSALKLSPTWVSPPLVPGAPMVISTGPPLVVTMIVPSVAL